MSYPIVELTRVIIEVLRHYPNVVISAGDIPKIDFIWELIGMWFLYILGMAILAWRLKKG